LLNRAYTTTKEEAFAAPLAFVDVGAFYDGQNGECPQFISEKEMMNMSCRSQ